MKRVWTISLALMMAFAIGCAKEKDKDNSSGGAGDIAPVDFTPPGTGPGLSPGADFSEGGTAAFTFVSSQSTFEEYADTPRNGITEAEINANLVHFGNGGYGGTISLRYKNGGSQRLGTFISYRRKGSLQKNDEANNRHNVWYVDDSQQLRYNGFFEDLGGGVIFIIDEVTDNGDGQGPEDLANGELWFKNHRFDYGTGPISPTSCWFVSAGPFDCRAWITGGGIDSTQGTYPDNNYKKIGEFTGLSLEEAFNGELNL